jgi:hypothetical protein
MCGVLFLAPPAHAYVRAVTNLGVPTWWRTPHIAMQMYLGAPPPLMSASEYFSAGQQAASAWSQESLPCTEVKLAVNDIAQPSSDAVVGLDLKNVIVFRQDIWCEHPLPSDGTSPTCYPPSALAVTTVFKSTSTGEIVDADLEINAVSFFWADLVSHPEQADGHTADFQNTVTHELGHVLGLDHNCANTQPLLKDNTGNDEPSCSGLNVPASVTEATMYPVVPLSDTLRRTLAADDEQAMCDIYPAEPGYRFAGGGCSTPTRLAPRPTPLAMVGAVFALFLALLLVTRKPRRRFR